MFLRNRMKLQPRRRSRVRHRMIVLVCGVTIGATLLTGPSAVADEPFPVLLRADAMGLDMAYMWDVVRLLHNWDDGLIPAIEELLIPRVYEQLSPGVYGDMVAHVLDQAERLERSGTFEIWARLTENPDLCPPWPPWPFPWPPWPPVPEPKPIPKPFPPDCYPIWWALREAALIPQVLERHGMTSSEYRDLIRDNPEHAAEMVREVLERISEYITSDDFQDSLEILTTDGLKDFLRRFGGSAGMRQGWTDILSTMERSLDRLQDHAGSFQAELLGVPLGEDVARYAAWTPVYHGTIVAVLLASDSLISSPFIPLPPPKQ